MASSHTCVVIFCPPTPVLPAPSTGSPSSFGLPLLSYYMYPICPALLQLLLLISYGANAHISPINVNKSEDAKVFRSGSFRLPLWVWKHIPCLEGNKASHHSLYSPSSPYDDHCSPLLTLSLTMPQTHYLFLNSLQHSIFYIPAAKKPLQEHPGVVSCHV